MSSFFDTSILVAAFDDQDEQHAAAWPLYQRRAAQGAIALHSLAEAFSILTGRRAWQPADAACLLKTNTRGLKLVSLSGEEYFRTLERAQGLGIRGGAVYDALILACARKARAESIYTFNREHFLLFASPRSNKRGPVEAGRSK